MENFKIEVIKNYEYLVKVDPEIWNEEARNEWRKVFWEAKDNEEIAKTIALSFSTIGLDNFHEGFGYIKTFFSDGSERKQFYKDKDGNYQIRTDGHFVKGISVTLVSVDDEIGANLID